MFEGAPCDPALSYHEEGLAPQEVDGILSMGSFERPSDGDSLDLGDLELLVTQCMAPPILQDPMRIRLQNVVTGPLHP